MNTPSFRMEMSAIFVIFSRFMVRKYLIDTSIWIDLYEDRVGFNGEPLGEYALKLISMIRSSDSILVITDFLIAELETKLSLSEIRGIFAPFTSILERVSVIFSQKEEAKRVAVSRLVPKGDALYAIVARDTGAILIARDNHFRKLADISLFFRPEDIFSI